MAKWTNADGLTVDFSGERLVKWIGDTANDDDVIRQAYVDFEYDALPGFDKDANNDGTNDSFSDANFTLPAGAIVTRAFVIVKTAFAGGTSYTIGTYKRDGTAVDADGFGTAVNLAVANLTAGACIALSGAQIAATVGSDEVGVKVTASGTFTAGTARLVLEYIYPRS